MPIYRMPEITMNPEEEAIFDRLYALERMEGFGCACPGPAWNQKLCGCQLWMLDRWAAANALATGVDDHIRKPLIMISLAQMLQVRSLMLSVGWNPPVD